MSESKGKKKKRKQKLLDEDESREEGIANPIMTEEGYTSDTGLVYSGGEESAPESIEDIMDAENLTKDMKTKHLQKQRELSEVTSPKEDLAGELRDIKKKSKKKVEDTIRQEEESEKEETARLEKTEEYAEDGTLPMPEGEEEGEPTIPTMEEETETTGIKRMKKKKEEPIESEIKPLTEEETKEEKEEVEKKEKEEEKEKEKEKEEESKTLAPRKSRLKDRLAKAKQEAKTEVQQEQREERREKRLKEQQQRITRFDTEYDNEEYEKMQEEKTQMLKKRWKKMGQEREKATYMPSQEEAYDFFTRIWEPEPEEPVEKPKEEEKEEEEEEEDEEEENKEGKEDEDKDVDETEEGTKKKKKKKKEVKEDEEALLKKEDEIDDEGFGLVAIRKAEYPDQVELEKKAGELLHIPSITRVPYEQKVGEEEQPRFLEEEGFYVGNRPQPKGWNLNMMEHRLLKEPDGRRWFGEDGRMISLPDPLRVTPSRPPVSEEKEPYLETVFKAAVIREYNNKYIDGSISGSGFYQLDVDINSIGFKHHHLFSREHVLASHLSELYKSYLTSHLKNMTEYLTEKLKALKVSTLKLRDHMVAHKSEHGYSDRSNYERRIKDYKAEIKMTRKLRDEEEAQEREILNGIISTWKDIKKLRAEQKYTNTTLKLQIRKEDVDQADDERWWKQEIEEELMERREEEEDRYVTEMEKYEQQKKAKEAQIKAKAEAAKRLKKRGSKASQKSRASRASAKSKEQEEEVSPEQKKKDEAILAEEDLPDPEPPAKFDEVTEREKILEKAMRIRRRPGEPKIYPELTNTMSITPDEQCPRPELQRRDALKNYRIFIRILFNNKEVSRTDERELGQDFRVDIGKIFNIKIVQWPESIKYQVYEVQGFKKEMIAEIYSNIPEVSITSKAVQLENVEFTSDLRVSHGKGHQGIGSGVEFSFSDSEECKTLITNGQLMCSVAWGVDEEGQPLAPPVTTSNKDNIFSALKKKDPLVVMGKDGKVDIESLKKWFEENRVDPNDPKNAHLMYLMKPKGSDLSHLIPPEYFRLEQLQEEFNVATDEDIENNKRFKLLSLRDNEVQEFKNYKMVPLNIREIPRDTFAEYDRKKREDERIEHEEIDEKTKSNRYMQKVREQVMQRFRLFSHLKRLEDVVIEEAVPNIAMLGTSLINLTQRRRPMRPVRKERKRVTAQAIDGKDVHILVNITRALFVPLRSAASPVAGGGASTARETTRTHDDALVKPYVEVMFQNTFMRTVVGDGPNPSFNQELQIPFKAPNEDYSPRNLQDVDDKLYLNLFDEMVIDIQEDDRGRGTTVHQRIEKKWLGSLTIPFTTIYFNNKVDGTFGLDMPPILLGYEREGDRDEKMEGKGPRKEDNTYLSLFITIEPPLVPAEPMIERFPSNESDKLLSVCEMWQRELKEKFPTREYKTTVVSINGQSVFICRYFKALKPPPDLTTLEQVARFVSLIPFVADSVAFSGVCDIWSTCDQFLQMCAGDEEEHAVLLLNYFLSIGATAYLVLGTGIPEGSTAYVLTYEDSNYYLWNASTGRKYPTSDYYCPLQSVGCVMNLDNIWGNIQRYDKPSQMEFEFNKTSDWRPFFTNTFKKPPFGSNQPEALHYYTTSENDVIEMQERIEQMLKNKIMEWRARHITRWNRHCTQMMRRILPELEGNLGKHMHNLKQIDDLKQTFSSYKVSGFPLNMGFTDLNDISERVYATGVHSHETSDVEFALAVYIHPYPNSVMSIWVYVASLIRQR